MEIAILIKNYTPHTRRLILTVFSFLFSFAFFLSYLSGVFSRNEILPGCRQCKLGIPGARDCVSWRDREDNPTNPLMWRTARLVTRDKY